MLKVGQDRLVSKSYKRLKSAPSIGDARLMKLGRRLAVGEIWLHAEGRPEPVAHAVATYSIPPRPA